MTTYELMRLDDAAAIVDLADGSMSLREVLDASALPAGTAPGGGADPWELEVWWDERRIPDSREGIGSLLERAGFGSPEEMTEASMGLCVSDCHWIRPAGSRLGWDDVCPHRVPFPGDLGDMIMDERLSGRPGMPSPDCATDGALRKRWTLRGRPVLVKAGRWPLMQEPLCEAVASLAMDALGIPHTGYDLEFTNGMPASVCPAFTDGTTELVTAGRLVSGRGDCRPVPTAQKFLDACSVEGLDVSGHLERMAVVDFLMMNTDRHSGNYGLLRDSESGEWLGPAPVYDTGTSLMCGSSTDRIADAVENGANGDAVPPILRDADLSWVDTETLHGIVGRMERMLRGYGMDPGRAGLLPRLLECRIGRLERLVSPSSPLP
ncbi:MAG: hypothetical protein Q4Q62_03730 [Thermoplasmata archaeon]|nr:hypothetical protein [Thermoplasmata archaeon]